MTHEQWLGLKVGDVIRDAKLYGAPLRRVLTVSRVTDNHGFPARTVITGPRLRVRRSRRNNAPIERPVIIFSTMDCPRGSRFQLVEDNGNIPTEEA